MSAISERSVNAMIASDFQRPKRRSLPGIVRSGAHIPLVGLGVPLAKALELAGLWPRILLKASRRGTRDFCFAGYQPTGHDVFACVGFRTGTNWLLQIAVQIAHLREAESDGLADDSPIRSAPARLRIMETHLEHGLVPYSPEARYLVMVRDPKNVILSEYQLMRSLLFGPLMPSIRHWVELNLTGDLLSVSWARHLASYWRVRNQPNVLFLTYEDFRAAPADLVRQIAHFMRVNLDTLQLEAVMRVASFRPGEADQLLSPELGQLIDEHSRCELRRLNCDFPYDLAYVKGQSISPICGGH